MSKKSQAKARAQFKQQQSRATTRSKIAANTARNSAGFINAYNKGTKGPKYGTPAFKAAFNPAQPFGGSPAPPAPPATPYSLIGQAGYDATVGNANTAAANTVAENTYQSGQLSQEYGIDDASNPFSKMTMLQQAYERDKLGQGNAAASRGQFFSSAYSADKKLLGDTNLANQDALKREYASRQHDLTYSTTQANAAATAAGASANYQRLIDNLGQ